MRIEGQCHTPFDVTGVELQRAQEETIGDAKERVFTVQKLAIGCRTERIQG
ncbi:MULTISPECIES: hypothetical protein [Pseudomonas]|uniref:hypothetical protein n=1 Tax=Pseudomonas TaxID=286 RepID=UPI001BE91A98|nr:MULTISPECIES: hypothetical protein [Pseudomonas]MBT2340536.1 hypothetical protein [Pseudomonas fluorescens]